MSQTTPTAAAVETSLRPPQGCYALLDDNSASSEFPCSRLYSGFVGQLDCADAAGLPALLETMQQRLASGLFAVALFDYELGIGLNGLSAGAAASASARARTAGRALSAPQPAVVRDAPQAAGQVARILLFSRCERLSAIQVERWLADCCADTPTGAGPDLPATRDVQPAGVMNLRESVSEAGFAAAIDRIHQWLRAGDAYQVNYTWRLRFQAYGEVAALYARLRQRQPVPYGALIVLPDGAAVLSLSPELFLHYQRGLLTARPMKGTAAASGEPAEDQARARALAADSKNRSENLMIVDLLRNDLGRVAEPGSVQVPQLFEVSRHGAVLQMTSTVQARLAPGQTLAQTLGAIYPCGSITGAPKRRAMEIIAELEPEPRGIYTGAIGWFDAPLQPGQVEQTDQKERTERRGLAACASEAASQPQPIGDFCLSVPIRTLAFRPADAQGVRSGEMGIGAGIVIESRAAEEFAECRLKGGFLSSLPPQFELIETMHASREHGVRHLDLHLQRLRASAACFGFVFEQAEVVKRLQQQISTLPPGQACRIRLALGAAGQAAISSGLLAPLAAPARVLLAEQKIDSAQLFQRHKSSVRQRYDAAWRLAESQGAFDMLFFNERDELAEGARSNVFVRLDGQWCTPPLSAGALPGVMRAVLLADAAWSAQERCITRAELLAAQEVVICNALRGALEVTVAAWPDARGGVPRSEAHLK